MTQKARLVLADDHVVLRSGLRMLLEGQGDFAVVGEAPDGRTAVELACSLRPDVVLMDISMPGMDGMEATRQITQCCPGVKVMVLTMHDDAGYLREVLAAGAAGYVLKKAIDEELIGAIRTVVKGGMFVYPTMTRALVDNYLARKPEPAPVERPLTEQLSPRELAVLKLVAKGLTSREIGDQLGLSAKTVDSYRARIGEKLGSNSRADLIRHALQAGLLD